MLGVGRQDREERAVTVNLNEWRKDAEIMLARNQQPGGSVDAVHLARRLIAACKALEAYRYARTARAR